MKHAAVGALLTALCIVMHAHGARAQDIQWYGMNGPDGGVITALVAGPGGVFFAGSEEGGIFRSIDGGATWAEPSRAMRALKVAGLAMKPNGHLFACGAVPAAIDAINADGLYLSTDGGGTWKHTTDPTPSFYPTCCATAPNGDVYVGSYSGIFRTTDEGVTWKIVGAAGDGGYISHVTTARDGSVYYATLEVSDANRVMRYRPGGDSTELALPLEPSGITGLTVTPFGGVYISTFDGLYRSFDRGANWATVTFDSPISIEALGSDSTGAVYAATAWLGFQRSVDSGATWSQLDDLFIDRDLAAVAIRRDGHIALGSRGDGIYRSNDTGATWSWSSAGIAASTVASLATESSGHLFAGTYGGGLYRNDGGAWTRLPLARTHITALVARPGGTLYAGALTTGAGAPALFRSSDDGASWQALDSSGASAISMAVDNDGTIFLVSGSTFYRKRTIDPIARDLKLADGLDAVAVDDAGHVYLAQRDSSLLVSSDHGETWSLGTGLAPGTEFTSIVAGIGEVYAAGNAIYRTTDGGSSWSAVANPLDNDHQPTSLAVHPDGTILLGSASQGVFRSKDHGATWDTLDRQLPTYAVRSVAFDSTGRMYAGTADFGVYGSGPVSGVTGNDGRVDAGAMTVTCAPSVCSAATTVWFSNDRPQPLAVDLYDSRGVRVARIADRMFEASTHALRIDASGLSAGMYMVCVTGATGRHGTRFVVVR